MNSGIITGNVVKGRYTVSVDCYISKEIIIDENLTEIVFEYDAFEIVRWDHRGHGLAHVNDSEPYRMGRSRSIVKRSHKGMLVYKRFRFRNNQRQFYHERR